MNRLEVHQLKVWDTINHQLIAEHPSLHLKQASCLAIVGESGSGKSVTCRAIMQLLKPGLRQSGDIFLDGQNLASLTEKEMRRKRGKQIGMIMQNGLTAFNPSCRIGVHLKETLKEHFDWSHSEIITKMKNAMECVRLVDPIEMMHKYPYQLSGGMLQRIMIALALVLEPGVLIADEPTSALDTVSQFEVIEQLIQLQYRMGCSLIFVSHDLGVVQKIADEALVMKDGAVIERGDIRALFSEPKHEYTRQLISAKLVLQHHYDKVMKEEPLLVNR